MTKTNFHETELKPSDAVKYYKGISIIFPGWFKIRHRSSQNIGTVHGPDVAFVRNGYGISVQMGADTNIPYALSDSTEVQSLIIKPLMTVVDKELSTIDDLLQELGEFVKEGQIRPRIEYNTVHSTAHGRIEISGFKAIDGTINTHQPSFNDESPFQNLRHFKGIPENLLKEPYKAVAELSKYVDSTAYPYSVFGRNLRETTRHAIEVYEFGRKLKDYKTFREFMGGF